MIVNFPGACAPVIALPQKKHKPLPATLVELGEELKPLLVEYFSLKPKWKSAYRKASDYAGFHRLGPDRTSEQQAAAQKRFEEASIRYGYNRICEQINSVSDRMQEIAKAIMCLPSDDRLGDGILAAASLVLNEECENAFEMAEVLWQMAARAGFTPPAPGAAA
jgi:hypothetical protein